MRTKFDIYVLITSAISEYQHLLVTKQQTILVLLLLSNIYDCNYVTKQYCAIIEPTAAKQYTVLISPLLRNMS
jgi:hypothetical protein